MQVFSKVCFVHWESIRSEEQRQQIKSNLEKNYEVIGITYDEMEGGVSLGVEFTNGEGKNGIIISKYGFSSMTPLIHNTMEKYFNPIIAAAIPVNEDVGGSSIECMFQTIPILVRREDGPV